MERCTRRLRGITLLLIVMAGGWVTAAAAQQTRYVVPSKNALGDTTRQYPVWTSRQAQEWCASTRWNRMFNRGATQQDEDQACRTGVAGMKPMAGMVTVGTVVELLDSRQCGKMAHVRVLSGPLQGEVGCVPVEGLSSVRPEGVR
jgi:hypothetical protein